MKKGLRFAAIAAAVVMVLTACSSTSTKTDKPAENTVQETATKKVTDILGREVEVPSEVNSIIALGAGGLRMICYAEQQDKVIGVEESEQDQTLAKGYNYVNYESFKDLPIVGTGGAGGYEAYEEEIIKIAPDVIFAAYPKDLADDLQNKTGIPVVVIMYDGGMFDGKLYQSMELIGNVLNCQDRCTEVVNALKDWQEDLASRTANIPDDSKPNAFTGACSFSGGHGIEGTYAQFPPFTAIGAKNVADGLSETPKGIVVDLEQITVWDPEYIFLDPNNMELVNENYAVNANFYDSLSAVKNGKVYSQVAYNWYTTNIETAVVDSYYAGVVMFPDKFDDVDIKTLANNVYTTLLGDKAAGYYDALVAGGLGWRQLTIGE